MSSSAAKELVEFVRSCQTGEKQASAYDMAAAAYNTLGWGLNGLYSGLIDYPAYALGNLISNNAPANARAKVQDAFNQGVSDQAWRHVGSAGLGGLGLGLSLRALQAAAQKPTRTTTTFDPLALPLYTEKENEKKLVKKANSTNFWTLLQNVPWMGAGMATAGIGGAYGGYKALDAVLDTQRDMAVDRELEEAKARYEKALRASYTPQLKKATELSPEEQTGVALDEAFDIMSKQAQDPRPPSFDPSASTVPAIGSVAANVYGPYAMALALIGGLGGYRLTAGQSRRSAIQEAASRRAASRLKNEAAEVVPEYKVLSA